MRGRLWELCSDSHVSQAVLGMSAAAVPRAPLWFWVQISGFQVLRMLKVCLHPCPDGDQWARSPRSRQPISMPLSPLN